MSDKETIVAAAVWYKSVAHSVPAPGRHCDVIRKMAAAGLSDDPNYCYNQGFVTSTGRFVKRKVACCIAEEAGQLNKVRPKTHPLDTLFSEDVW